MPKRIPITLISLVITSDLYAQIMPSALRCTWPCRDLLRTYQFAQSIPPTSAKPSVFSIWSHSLPGVPTSTSTRPLSALISLLMLRPPMTAVAYPPLCVDSRRSASLRICQLGNTSRQGVDDCAVADRVDTHDFSRPPLCVNSRRWSLTQDLELLRAAGEAFNNAYNHCYRKEGHMQESLQAQHSVMILAFRPQTG